MQLRWYNAQNQYKCLMKWLIIQNPCKVIKIKSTSQFCQLFTKRRKTKREWFRFWYLVILYFVNFRKRSKSFELLKDQNLCKSITLSAVPIVKSFLRIHWRLSTILKTSNKSLPVMFLICKSMHILKWYSIQYTLR